MALTETAPPDFLTSCFSQLTYQRPYELWFRLRKYILFVSSKITLNATWSFCQNNPLSSIHWNCCTSTVCIRHQTTSSCTFDTFSTLRTTYLILISHIFDFFLILQRFV
jgi:hypothetical protein